MESNLSSSEGEKETQEAYSILFTHLFRTFMNKDFHSDSDPWVIFKQETPGEKN